MAKLSAYGQTTLYRVARESTMTTEVDANCCWKREEVAVMDNRRVLRRLVVRFHPDKYDPKGRRHDYGWKVYGRLKEGGASDYLMQLLAAGWTRAEK